MTSTSTSTSNIKITAVQKDANIRPAVVHNSNEYIDFDKKDMSDPAVIDDMVHAINELDKDSHAELYLTIRKFRTRKFFAPNGTDTKFNIYGLNERERSELDHTISLCRENMARRKIVDSLHQQREDITRDLSRETTHTIETVNPSEPDKIREMLHMNKTRI